MTLTWFREINWTLLCLAVLMLFGIEGCKPKKPIRNPRSSAPAVVRDVPPILRGTIGAEASIVDPSRLIVSSYGIVVGLSGTGSSDIPIPIRSELEREAALHGFGQASSGLKVTPTELLNDLNTAAVIVEGVIPPGAPAGYRFDLAVTIIPGTSTTSLEGGRLFSTDLRPGLPSVGRAQSHAIAKGGGPIFLNPFAEPGKLEAEGALQTTGRILNGGVVTESRPLELRVDNPSHARVRVIVDAINRNFPRQYGMEDTARGLNDERIRLNVPSQYREDPESFIQLILHTRIDQRFPGEFARKYVQALESQPELSNKITWCLQALGTKSLPVLKELYDYSEVKPRLAALRAGAMLGDPLVIPRLVELAEKGAPFLRPDAIRLLAYIPGPNPRIHKSLYKFIDDDDLSVRIAAYETLVARDDWNIKTVIVDGKMRIDYVPSAKPLVYASLQKKPRLVVFGDVKLKTPILISAWSDRLLINADGKGPIRLYYRPLRPGETPIVMNVDQDAVGFIQQLGHKTTIEEPEPGLNLSYSETIGALYAIAQQGGLNAPFEAEQDRLTNELLAATQLYSPPPRADSPRDEIPETPREEKSAAPTDTKIKDDGPRSLVVPLIPKKEGKK